VNPTDYDLMTLVFRWCT